ncbi:MAG TPA: hypothetical protein DCY55_08250 [Gammaproteobacteria bacterium]|nr:hypothetical protein [Gammaproteobacteria bacterium]
MSNIYAKLGAVIYVIWGVLHIVAARAVYMLGQSLDPGMIQGRIFQDAWNLLFFAIFGIVVGICFNWKNSRLGYWLNLIVVSVGDIGYIIFLMVPGYVAFMPGALGPITWLLAALLSTIGILSANQSK